MLIFVNVIVYFEGGGQSGQALTKNERELAVIHRAAFELFYLTRSSDYMQ